jgi:hypothetical protein
MLLRWHAHRPGFFSLSISNELVMYRDQTNKAKRSQHSMNDNKTFMVPIGASLIIAAGLFLAGCEVDSASSTIEITPDSVTLASTEQSVTLTCVGGYECTWSLATEAWGTLNTRRGISVVYTSHYQPPAGSTPVQQIVTVASRFTTMSGMDQSYIPAGATNIPGTNTQYASAYITHLPAVSSAVAAVTSTLDGMASAAGADR